MSFDGTVTRIMTHELQNTLQEGRITKLYQPNPYEILLILRAQGQNYRLLLSAHPKYQRFHLTQTKLENPPTPPAFCMLLRKHLEGGQVEAITQIDMERVVFLDVRTRNELGDPVIRRLAIEIMGRHSNTILIDAQSNTVLDAIRRVTPEVSQQRQILPGIRYELPPEQGKKQPFPIDHDTFIASLDFNQGRLDRQLINQFQGIGPQVAKEIVYQAGIGERDRLWESFADYMKRLQQFQYQPSLVQIEQKEHFAIWPLHYLQGTIHSYPTMSECLDQFYSGKAEQDRRKQKNQGLVRRVRNEIGKNQKKIGKLQDSLEQAEQAEQYRIYGELITAYMHQVQRGDRCLEAVNYYDPEGTIWEIPLDPQLSPSQNAQRYFKRYHKQKRSKQWSQEQIQLAEQDNHYLEMVLYQLQQASIPEIEEIQEELVEQGILKRQRQVSKKRKRSKPSPLSLYASDGTLIWIGKNNKQNDYLTFTLAKSHDTWFHTKDIPGSHVVIHSPQASEQTLWEAAALAAYFSKAHTSSQVPVDYTKVKHVKKIPGARPGLVTYKQQQTLYLTPDHQLVKRLLKNTD